MVSKFLDKNEVPKETIALEYIYARRTRGNVSAFVFEQRHQARSVERCSGNLNQSRFLCRSASVVLTLDLTRPNEMWVAMESLLENASRCTDVAIKALDQKSQAAIKSRMAARCSEYKVDPHSIMFVLFQNFDSEQRRRICTTLRFLAHYYGAHLMFYSCYNEQLVRVGRSMFSHLAFGTSAPKAKVDDHNKPLYVVCGMDTFEVSCQHATVSERRFKLSQATERCTLPSVQKRDDGARKEGEQELFQEPLIDSLVAQREKVGETSKRCHYSETFRKDRQAAELRAAEKINTL
ncbi:unnamed protein product [Heligmosomoides polygyrus]|uniref:mRNA (guanine-N(7)-)-methyltransferase n=1 Tax=Heligmosomoides polygyrus TaxID=6339 RepID=A0A3P8C129_HELPZ|nr:unnamed protein product [Heligmosomoides polygyrus]